MAQIKHAIESLCTVLNFNRQCAIQAESFRQAKFDRHEQTRTFWLLLFDSICYSKYLQVMPEAHLSDVTLNLFECKHFLPISEQIVVYVKHYLYSFGYGVASFYQLPNNMSYGSRELLLAFSWLLAKRNIIESYIHNIEDILSIRVIDEIIDRAKNLLWQYGRLNHKLKTLLSSEKEQIRIMHKLHIGTWDTQSAVLPDCSHLSSLECYLLANPKDFQKGLLDQRITYLSALASWIGEKDLFWKWMESVLEEKFKDSSTNDLSEVKKPQKESTITKDLVAINKLLLEKIENNTQYLSRISVSDDPEKSSRYAQLRSAMASRYCQSTNQMKVHSDVNKQANQYILIKKSQKNVNHLSNPEETMKYPIADVIEQLNEATNQLKTNLMIAREKYKILMDDLLSNSTGILRLDQARIYSIEKIRAILQCVPPKFDWIGQGIISSLEHLIQCSPLDKIQKWKKFGLS
ncbi:uncharacterized protein TRIADDRAFT_57775 [Trichoplax adhaerens]|uniref:Tubulin epsilon and delta complex protein 1 domain-containing protein n=1 Tax=Trichoplax adhaerens TaxID=10228 RepID=B3S0D7_TRIAD|nr:predicted protein [Trichoplax adhaerens]EDV23997.1 predicted protein [Trichoplax adhaerens]|eukprot:XP_002113523.1 predicted protein [Trichoplax adhaerens]